MIFLSESSENLAEIVSIDAVEESEVKTKQSFKNNRLIGFHTRSGLNNAEPKLITIRSIALIYDSSNCEFGTPNKVPGNYTELVDFTAYPGQQATKMLGVALTTPYGETCACEMTIEPDSSFFSLNDANGKWTLNFYSD